MLKSGFLDALLRGADHIERKLPQQTVECFGLLIELFSRPGSGTGLGGTRPHALDEAVQPFLQNTLPLKLLASGTRTNYRYGGKKALETFEGINDQGGERLLIEGVGFKPPKSCRYYRCTLRGLTPTPGG